VHKNGTIALELTIFLIRKHIFFSRPKIDVFLQAYIQSLQSLSTIAYSDFSQHFAIVYQVLGPGFACI
jgi:hypothetical protein